jgi:hypothetical protein
MTVVALVPSRGVYLIRSIFQAVDRYCVSLNPVLIFVVHSAVIRGSMVEIIAGNPVALVLR